MTYHVGLMLKVRLLFLHVRQKQDGRRPSLFGLFLGEWVTGFVRLHGVPVHNISVKIVPQQTVGKMNAWLSSSSLV